MYLLFIHFVRNFVRRYNILIYSFLLIFILLYNQFITKEIKVA